MFASLFETSIEPANQLLLPASATRIGIRERLFGSIGILAACLLLVGLLGAFSFERMTDKAEASVADQVQPLEQLKIISDNYAVEIVDTSHKTRASDISWFEARRRVVTAKREIERQWAAYLATQHTSDEQKLIDQAVNRKNEADRATRELQTILLSRDQAGLVAFVEGRMYPAIDPLTESIAGLINLQVAASEQELANVYQLKRTVLALMLLVFFGCSAVVVFAFHTVGGRVIQPIRSMTAAMERLAKDDLDFELPEARSNDETGTMARAVEVFRQTALDKRGFENERQSVLDREAAAREEQERLLQQEQENRDRLDRAALIERQIAEFQAEVASLLEGVDQAAQHFHATATSMREAAQLSTQQANAVSAGANVAAANVQTVAAATHEMSLSIEEIGRNVATSEAVVERASSHAKKADKITGALTDDAARIGAIIEMIRGIAGQTNLLALNATIEAARAGEAGKSFGVVANEIKALASKSSTASDEIEQLVRSIQNTSVDAAEAMTSIREVIEQTRSSAMHIATSIDQQAGATDEISRSSTRAADAAEQVSAAIGDVSKAADKTESAAAQMVESAGELATRSASLRSCVEVFTLKLRAA